jgi:uncharacterized repeat protein (TIGR01451 family)
MFETPKRWLLLSLLPLGLCSCAGFRGVESLPGERSVSRSDATQSAGRVSVSSPAPSQPPAIQPAAYLQPTVCPPPPASFPMIQPPVAALPAPVLPEGNPVHLYPDEYLFDGGDRDKPVHYDEFRRLGLDTEDTVAEYTDHLGKRKVKPTNRVAVYAPRFAAVRTVSQAADGTSSRQVSGLQEQVRVAGVRSRAATANHKGRNVPDLVRVRVRGSGIDGERKDVTLSKRTAPATNRANRRPLENVALLRSGAFDRTQEAALAMGIQAAASWTKRRYPVIVGSRQDSTEVSARSEQHFMTGSDDSHKTKGELRIVKVADKETAKPGDVVTFTIRYDNVGDRELHHIRIVDNLSPRLVYVGDSADSDRKGKLVVEDNAEGSLVLKFELTEPLKGHAGGVVKFKARVR